MKRRSEKEINAILLIYHHPLKQNAPTIMQHVNSFEENSEYKVFKVNTELGFPSGLISIDFKIIVLHYSLFGNWPYHLSKPFLDYLETSNYSYKVCFFQDEFRYCQCRFSFLNRYKIDCVYTMVTPQYFKDVYAKYTSVPKLISIPSTGYVSADLIELSKKITKPDSMRMIDIGYRARCLEFYMGKGAQEKTEIAIGFCKRSHNLELKLDVKVSEDSRIYGLAWYKFLSNCRAVLGVDTGVSIFDIDDIVRPECERLIGLNPNICFDEIYNRVLYNWENNIPYRTIGPRHFEAAVFRVCQILFEGKYSGILKPMIHYIPLKKDFSNFDEVIRLFRNKYIRTQITENAYRDLIESGRYSYKRFIKNFDQELLKSGFSPEIDDRTLKTVTMALNKDQKIRQLYGLIKTLIHNPFPGKLAIKKIIKPIFDRYRERNR